MPLGGDGGPCMSAAGLPMPLLPLLPLPSPSVGLRFSGVLVMMVRGGGGDGCLAAGRGSCVLRLMVVGTACASCAWPCFVVVVGLPWPVCSCQAGGDEGEEGGKGEDMSE